MAVLFAMVLILAFAFLIDAGLVWLLCWALNSIGIYSICGISVEFSWTLAIAVTVIVFVIRCLFGGMSSDNK